jgi:capsular exopolysaccharide synthesis family protein
MTDVSPLARYLVPVRRWWYVVVGLVLVAVIAAVVTQPSPPGDPTPEQLADPEASFRASHLLIRNQASPEPINFDLVELLARQGDLTSRVLERMGSQIDTRDVDQVELETDAAIGTISITTVQPTPDLAASLVTTYAEELQAIIDERAAAAIAQTKARVDERIGALDDRIQALESQISELPEEDLDRRLLEAERDQLIVEFATSQGESGALGQRLSRLEPQFETLQEPAPVSTDDLDGPLSLPRALLPRVLAAALLAALAGAVVANVLSRLDTRVRTRRDAEEAFGLPVIAQFPTRSRSERDRHPLPVVTEPGGSTAESFRALRLAIMTAPVWRLAGRAPTTEGSVGSVAAISDRAAPRTLVVTSSLMSDGKSTLVANLAASFAESDQQVLVVDCDFRRPAVGELLGVPKGTGMTDLERPDRNPLFQLVQRTDVSGVSLIRSGNDGITPPWFVTQSASVVEHAASLADVVIFDTGPILLTNEATALIRSVDSVVLVTRAAKLRRNDARLTIERLAQASADVAGVVLVGGEMSRRYGYGYYGTEESSPRPASRVGRGSDAGRPEDAIDPSTSS